MGSGQTVDFLGANHKYDVQYELFIPPKDSSFHDHSRSVRMPSDDCDRESCFWTGNEEIDESAIDPSERLLYSQQDIHCVTHSETKPDIGLRLIEPSVSSSLHPCTQLELRLSTTDENNYCKNQMGDSMTTSWASNSVGSPRQVPEETSSDFEVGLDENTCNSCASPRIDSPIVEWIQARLEDWKHHLNLLPTTGNPSHRLQDIATALTQLEEEIKLIRDTLLANSASAQVEDIGLSLANSKLRFLPDVFESSVVSAPFDNSRVIGHSLILHVSSNSLLYFFEELCYYMEELSAWSLGRVHNAVVFWHHRKDEHGFYIEKPDACATLPGTDITVLGRTEAHNFVNSVNRAQEETIFRVKTVFVGK